MARKPPGPRPKKSGPVRDWHLWNAVGNSVDPLLRRKSADPKALLEALENSGQEPDSGKPRDTAPRFARPPLPSARPMIAASKIPASEKSMEPNLKRRVARGREPIDATLDLHGMTQDQARMALERFIPARVARGDRTVLVITGKGIKKTGYLQLEQKGVLREMVPLWLNATDLAPMVAGIDPAHQSHGGGGALYVRLKRKRQM
ncbi:Smr/MutS family protein [Pelagibacterium halotolerans]|uniref:Smr protein/MutS2 n=1 Tax=Pelagibacterium halotolerans (strain DSM 22347 / JCM 15775 / CGMCC 1.7692 / B2) TaxID=1082931 RepID=G4R7R6_PELHB|nr:Smr/MutS family protein [Pelagibacterium halotolerans]AEQ53326.1 Smr protein/MutS2 [Pelagibacterium halotolerans B2]QJR17061.1 DNA mismatch repair protein MutS [Pelagibacterium halotolerans]SEA62950.1 DNA-nicking endonuclease, Smr domain [Pelagibacterium halotolerans]